MASHRVIAVELVGLAPNLTSCNNASIPPVYLYLCDWCVFISISIPVRSISLIIRTIPLAYGALLLFLALFKAAEFWRLHGFHGSRLAFILIKDQAFYFTL